MKTTLLDASVVASHVVTDNLDALYRRSPGD